MMQPLGLEVFQKSLVVGQGIAPTALVAPPPEVLADVRRMGEEIEAAHRAARGGQVG